MIEAVTTARRRTMTIRFGEMATAGPVSRRLPVGKINRMPPLSGLIAGPVRATEAGTAVVLDTKTRTGPWAVIEDPNGFVI